MSLDVYLTLPGAPIPVAASERIFIRDNGGTREVTHDEWDEMQPGREPVAMVAEMDGREVYDANITHNMGRMAGQCGPLYEALWRPEELGATLAGHLIEPLRDGLAILRSDRERLQEFNPSNGWGNYDGLLRFTENYLAACEQWPEAKIEVSR